MALTEDRTQWLIEHENYVLHLDNGGEYYLDRPLLGRLTGTWKFKNNSIIIEKDDGTFVGVINSFDGTKLVTSETIAGMTAYTFYQRKLEN